MICVSENVSKFWMNIFGHIVSSFLLVPFGRLKSLDLKYVPFSTVISSRNNALCSQQNGLGHKFNDPFFAIFLLFAVGFTPKSSAIDAVVNTNKKQTEVVDGKTLAALRKKLDGAKTFEEKRILIDEFRLNHHAFFKRRLPVVEKRESPLQKLLAMKAQAKENPEMLARLILMEEQLKRAESIREKLRQANAAMGEKKQQLLDDVAVEQTKMSRARQAEADARLMKAMANDTEKVPRISPNMEGLSTNSEARKREIDQFREELDKASPEGRLKLLEDWRRKRQKEIAAMRGEMEGGQ